MRKEKLIGLTAVTAAVVAAVAPMKAEAHHHHGGFWGHGGRHFWPGFVGGFVGNALWGGYRPYAYPYYRTPVIYSAPVVTTPTVIQQPVYTQPVYAQPAPVYTQPVQQPVVQAPTQPAPQAQPTTVKIVVEHQYKTLEEVRAAAEAAKANQRQ